MRRFAAILTLLMFTTAACEEKGDEAAARDALPSAEYVKINLPEGASKPGGALEKVGELSPAYLTTLATALTLNTGAAFVLILVRVIVAFPVTSVEGDTLVWGPWHDDGDPGEYKLTARLSDEGVWEWALSGRRFGTAGTFQTVVSGFATPGRPRRGSGSFSIDFEVARAIDPASDGEGELDVEYDLERDPVTLVMDAEKLAPMPSGGSALQTFHYDYSETRDHAGELGFAIYGDTDDPASGWEMSDFRSRWQADGAGRADVSVTGGDMGTGSATATECWDAHFLRTYYTDSVAWIPTEGSPSSCVF